MNDIPENIARDSKQDMSSFLPLVFLGVSFLLILVFQITNQIAARNSLFNTIAQNEHAVQNSQNVQKSVGTFIRELNDAAPAETQAALTRLGIRVTSSGAPSAAPTATP